MSGLINQNVATQIRNLPKIDLHRHLEGSLRLETLYEIAQLYDLGLPISSLDQLRPYVQVTDDPPNHEAFLGKFEVLRHFYRSPDTISRVAYEAIADAAADNIKYLELRFSPQALSRVRGFPLDEVTDWVIAAVNKASQDYDIRVGLIITLVRHDPFEQAKAVAKVAIDRVGKGIVGLDLAGNEVKYPSTPFSAIFKEAKDAGLGITIHAGEWASAHGVEEAIEELYADRIGHGIRAMENSRILRLVKEKNIALEVCLTSNLQTGVVRRMIHHPLVDMLDLGMMVTLNTDDPHVSDITLSDEYEVALNELKIDYHVLRHVILNSARSAFLPADLRQKLVDQYDMWLPDTFSKNGQI